MELKSTMTAAKALNIDHKEIICRTGSISRLTTYKVPYSYWSILLSVHVLNLNGSRSLHPEASVIEDIKRSDYFSKSFCQTVLDRIIVDRLRCINDGDTNHHLQMIIEVPMPICIQDVYVNDEIVKAKAD